MHPSSVLEVEQGGRPVAVRIYQLPPDELVAFPFGLDAKTARGLVRRGELPSRKLGRKLYARRSDVLALVPPKAAMAVDLAKSVRSMADGPRAALARKVGGR